VTTALEKLAAIEAEYDAENHAHGSGQARDEAFEKLITLARELAGRLDSPRPPLLPIDPDDERIVDALMAKRARGLRVTRMGRVRLPDHEKTMRGFRCEPYGDGTIGCARCGKRCREICETYAEEIAAYADRLAAELHMLRSEVEGDNGLRASKDAGWAIAKSRLDALEKEQARSREFDAERVAAIKEMAKARGLQQEAEGCRDTDRMLGYELGHDATGMFAKLYKKCQELEDSVERVTAERDMARRELAERGSLLRPAVVVPALDMSTPEGRDAMVRGAAVARSLREPCTVHNLDEQGICIKCDRRIGTHVPGGKP
jgi:hypothetical protein